MVNRVVQILPYVVLAAVLFRVYGVQRENRALSEVVATLKSERRATNDQVHFWREVSHSLMRNAENPLTYEEPTLVYAFDPNCSDCWSGLTLLETYNCTRVEVVAVSVVGGHEIPEHVITDMSAEDWDRLPLVTASAVLFKDGKIRVWRAMTQSIDEIRSFACE